MYLKNVLLQHDMSHQNATIAKVKKRDKDKGNELAEQC